MGDLVFGWRTAVLAVAITQILLIAGALTLTLTNALANRTLAALLIVLAGIVTPWAIGFAGFYDRWQWLTFAPFAVTLAVAPLLWLYVSCLIGGGWPATAWRHLLPAAAQFTFLSIGFALPFDEKMRLADIAMAPYGAVTGIGTVVGLAAYGAASLRLLRRYRASLSQQRSDDARFASRWLSRAIAAALALLAIWSVYAVCNAISPLGYRDLMVLHIAIAIFAIFLAIEGWRHAELPFPRIDVAVLGSAPARDWAVVGERWANEVRSAGWTSDPGLTLARLARHLGTNTGYLSRALNEGLGVNFSAFVNGIRSETVAAAIRDSEGHDILNIAFEAGFASKASFNRAFRARHGVSPGEYRRAQKRKMQDSAGN